MGRENDWKVRLGLVLMTWDRAMNKQEVDSWTIWVKNRASGCVKREKAWLKKNGRSPSQAIEPGMWRERIIKALAKQRDGRGYFSRLPLKLSRLRPPTDALYPSVDHLDGPSKHRIVIETRLFNDMKTILSERQFWSAIRHLAEVSTEFIPKKLNDNWKPHRDFAGPEKERIEPPLSGGGDLRKK